MFLRDAYRGGHPALPLCDFCISRVLIDVYKKLSVAVGLNGILLYVHLGIAFSASNLMVRSKAH